MTQENQVDANTTQAAEAAVTPKVTRTTVKKADLTQAFVLERLELRTDKFEVDGKEVVQENFYWKVDTVASRTGDFAGSRREADGYYSVVLSGTNYSGKQLAVFYKTGSWPVAAAKVEKEKVVKEHTPRVASVPLSDEARKAAAKAAKEKAAARKAEKEAAKAATPAGETNAAEASTDAADTADIDSAVL